MGEFGHLLPQSVTPRAKFEALHRHFLRGSQQTKAKSLILIKCHKVIRESRKKHEKYKSIEYGTIENQRI